jgi:hypothetical protein
MVMLASSEHFLDTTWKEREREREGGGVEVGWRCGVERGSRRETERGCSISADFIVYVVFTPNNTSNSTKYIIYALFYVAFRLPNYS